MFDFAPALGRGLDGAVRPLLRLCHETLGLSPAQVTWAALGARAAAGVALAGAGAGWGRAPMAPGTVLAGVLAGVAREKGHTSPAGRTLPARHTLRTLA